MRKCDELSDPQSCLNRACDDEYVFVLLGRDPAAPATIRSWCAERCLLGKNSINDPQIKEALQAADFIEKELAARPAPLKLRSPFSP